MTELATFEEMELRIVTATKAIQAQQGKFDAANTRLNRTQEGAKLAGAELIRLSDELENARLRDVEQYVAALVDGTKKPDLSALSKLTAERERAEFAVAHTVRKIPVVRAAALEEESLLCDCHASLRYAEAELERAKALRAFESVSGEFGEGATLEVKGSSWQRLTELGDQLIHASRSLRRQSQELLTGSTGR